MALWAMWTYVVVSVGRLGEIIPVLGSLPLAKMAIGVAAIAMLASKGALGLIGVRDSRMVRGAIALLAVAVIMAPFSISHGLVAVTMINTGMPLAVSFVIIRKLCKDWGSTKKLMSSLVWAGAILSAGALENYTGARIEAGDSYDTNDLAYVLVTLLPIALAWAVTSKGMLRLACFTLAGTFLFITLLTQSRGGLLGTVACCLVLLFRPLSGGRVTTFRVLKWASIVVVAGALVVASLPSETTKGLASVFALENDYNTDLENNTGRLSIWTRNAKAGIERPIGYGMGTFGMVDLRTGGKFKAPHNSLLQVFVELGVIGLFIFLRIYYLAWRGLFAAGSAPSQRDGASDPTPPDIPIFSRALAASLAGNIVAGFFLTQAYSNLLWAVLALVPFFEIHARASKIPGRGAGSRVVAASAARMPRRPP